MPSRFGDKSAARDWVWDALSRERAARFPFPPHGRIPNFAGAKEAAERLLAHPLFESVRRIKVNPDAGQRPVRELALRRGITVYVPTPRLRAGFKCFDPARIPTDRFADAASLSKGSRFGVDVPLQDLPPVDLIVTGSVAVTRDGRRCGKGHGYGDLEYAIYHELGHPPVAVATTVHPLQIVNEFPSDPHDLTVSLVVTPQGVLEVEGAQPPALGIDWESLPARALEEMPVLAELRSLLAARRRRSTRSRGSR